MQSYTIQINELQRAVLEAALSATGKISLICKISGCTDAEIDEELSLLEGMFRDLPKEEADAPLATHCFWL